MENSTLIESKTRAAVAAVIVTYNRKELLIQCIRHVLDQKDADCDLLIIDNASTDGTQQAVSDLSNTRINYYNTGANLGGAGGFHFGLQKAYELGYEYFWLMDDDTLPEASALQRLVEAGVALHGTYGFLSSKALWTDGAICRMNVQRISPYRDVLFDATPCERIQMASFVSLFLKRDIVRQYGLPISAFFIWGDDWEYTRRISRTTPCYLISNSLVVHAMRENNIVNIATDAPDRLQRYGYAYRNDVYLYRREGVRGWLWVLAKDCWHSVQVLMKNCGHKMVRLKTIWKGFCSGIRFRPKIEYVE